MYMVSVNNLKIYIFSIFALRIIYKGLLILASLYFTGLEESTAKKLVLNPDISFNAASKMMTLLA